MRCNFTVPSKSQERLTQTVKNNYRGEGKKKLVPTSDITIINLSLIWE